MARTSLDFSLPEEIIPPTLAGFHVYLSEQLASSQICVTEPARAVAEVILRAPSLPAPLRLIAPAHHLCTAALLPPRLREEYGLDWSAPRALALRGGARSIRLVTTPLLLVAARISPPRLALSP